MQTISRSLSGSSTVGEAVATPWPVLNRDLKLHTRELCLVIGAPTAGKSVFALNVAISLDTPVLYFAQDSAPSVLARTAALTLGVEIGWVYEQLRDAVKKETIVSELSDALPNLFIQVGAMTLEGIDQRLEALTEVLGQAPPLVIIDNLIDTIVPGYTYTDMGFYSTSLPELKRIGMDRNVCIMALHHVTRRGGEHTNPHGLGTRALKMTDPLYSGERETEHVLGVYHNPGKDKMHIQILKQRDGDADAEGSMEVSLLWFPKLGKLGRA